MVLMAAFNSGHKSIFRKKGSGLKSTSEERANIFPFAEWLCQYYIFKK